MCLPLIGKIVTAEDGFAKVELVGGELVQANLALHPELSAGQFVLIDRGLIIEAIEESQAEEMLAFYTELETMLAEEDAKWLS